MLNTILYVVCILVLIIVLLIILTNSSYSADTSSSDTSSNNIDISSTTTVPSSTTTTTPSSTTDTKTLLTAEDMIYCLTNDNKCKKMSYETCTDDKGSSNFYMTMNNCNSALDNLTGKLDKRWCLVEDSCIEYNKDEIGFGLKIDDVSCSPQYTSKSNCENAVEPTRTKSKNNKETHYCYLDGICKELDYTKGDTCETPTYPTIDLCNRYNT